MWHRDIQKYCESRNKEFDKVEGILVRKGWNPENYRASMRDSLFSYLDKWYTLSIKNLPEPATKRNPAQSYEHTTELPDGWEVRTNSSIDGFLTTVTQFGRLVYRTLDSSIIDAETTHVECIEDIYEG